MNGRLTFAALIDRIALETGLSKRSAHELLKEFAGTLEEGLLNDGRVRVRGLGTFSLRRLKSRPGINPQTGATLTIPAHNKVAYRPDAHLKELVNQHFRKMAGIKVPKNYSGRSMMGMFSNSKVIKPLLYAVAAVVVVVIGLMVFRSGGEPAASVSEPAPVAAAVPEPVPEPLSIPETKPAVAPQPAPKPVAPPAPRKITVKSGDNLWNLAKQHYGDPFLWVVIYEANRAKISNPDLIRPGLELAVPNLEGAPPQLTRNDVRKVADGNAQAYLSYSKVGKADAKDYLAVAKRLDSQVMERWAIQLE